MLLRRGLELVIWQYLAWVAAEIVAMALFFRLFEIVILDDQRSFPDLLGVSVVNTSLTLLLPYGMLWLYFSWRDNKIKLAELKEQPDGSGTETDDTAPG